MLTFLKSLSGKRTHLLSLLVQLLGALFLADSLVHDDPATADVIETAWLTASQYAALAAMLGAGSLQALRAGVKSEAEKLAK